MRAARLHAYGQPLHIDDIPTPPPGVIALAESGRRRTIPNDVAPLDEVNAVYRRLKQGEIAGRAVIAPAV